MSKCKVSLVRNKDVKVAFFWAVTPGSQKIGGTSFVILLVPRRV